MLRRMPPSGILPILSVAVDKQVAAAWAINAFETARDALRARVLPSAATFLEAG